MLLAAAAMLLSDVVLAEGSVTVYGRLNTTVERQRSNNQSTYVLNDNASRIGFRGVHDLGAGTAASFLIEHGFGSDTGSQTGAAFWGRESWVALSGRFGRTRLGNMGATNAYFAIADYISLHNHDTGSSADAFYLYPGRATNMIAYTSPDMDGLVLDAQLSLSEGSQFGRTQVFTASYDNGPLHLGASYLRTRIGVAGERPREIGFRIFYEFGAFGVGGYFIRNDDSFGTDTRRNAFRAALMYGLGAGELHINYGFADRVKGNPIADDDARQITLGYNHNLSKRTKAYGHVTRVTDAKRLYGGSFSSLALGVRHHF